MYYNSNYFPTPADVIEQMLEPYSDKLKDWVILEPSAGMGAICDTLRMKGVSRSNVYVCEIDEGFCKTLAGKGHMVVNHDFLEYSGAMDFDLIVMNPPFENADQHLLKAIQIMRNGHIVCLVNEQTILNPYTETRQRLISEIQRLGGTITPLGAAFSKAERQTDVNVMMIRVSKKTEYSGLNLASFSPKNNPDFEVDDSDYFGLERRDAIGAYIRTYQMAMECAQQMYVAANQMRTYLGAICQSHEVTSIMEVFMSNSRISTQKACHNEFAKQIQAAAWRTIFSKTSLSSLATKKVADKFEQWRKQMGSLDVNEANVIMLMDAMMQSRADISKECIIETFDFICGSHYGWEKYRTNSRFFVPEKFILTYVFENVGRKMVSTNYYRQRELDDLDRALCIISGKRFEDIKRIVSWNAEPLGGIIETEFFKIKPYKNGNGHFYFRDEKLRQEFNRMACEAKGHQLPEQEFFRGKDRRSQKVK